MSLSIGTTIDGYEVLDYLDSSTRRQAFRARNHAAGRLEQIHILPDSLRNDPERAARFHRESRILASLNHPNILTCYGAVQIAGQLAISMELLEAVTLSDRLDLGAMSIEQAVRSTLQILAAAETLHAAGVVHREISPSNLLITPDQTIKLTGFALAKSVRDPNLTSTGAIFGELRYIAPEQVHGSLVLDPRTDIYAIGCVFYALLTGRPPFDAPSDYEILQAHVHLRPEPPSRRNPNLNHLLDAVVLTALEKNPADRYQSAAQFRDAILNPSAPAQSPTSPAEPANEPPVPPPAEESFSHRGMHAVPFTPIPPQHRIPDSPVPQVDSPLPKPASSPALVTVLIALLMVLLTAAAGWFWHLQINSSK